MKFVTATISSKSRVRSIHLRWNTQTSKLTVENVGAIILMIKNTAPFCVSRTMIEGLTTKSSFINQDV